METTFTHNDLHAENVLVYEIPNGQYVTMNYKTPFGDVSLKTRYICKIIDYGRSYFKDDRMSSENVRETLCENIKCGSECDKSEICYKGLQDSECGSDAGYKFFDTNLNYYNMSAILNNPGKDLWLIQIIKDFHVKYMSRSRLDSNVRYLVNTVFMDETHGVNYVKAHSTNALTEPYIYSVKDFMKKAIVCFDNILGDIQTYQSEELKTIDEYGTITIDAVTNTDYKFEMNYE